MFEITFKNGDVAYTKTFWDSDGCGPDPEHFDKTIARSGRNIDYVKVLLVMDDRDTPPDVVIYVDHTGFKDNQYT